MFINHTTLQQLVYRWKQNMAGGGGGIKMQLDIDSETIF